MSRIEHKTILIYYNTNSFYIFDTKYSYDNFI